MNIGPSIGSRLKQWRTTVGIGQKEASASLGIPFRTFQNYELDNTPPGADSMKCFLRAGISIDWLLSGEGEMLLADRATPAQSSQPAPPSPIDEETLAFVIESLETGLSKRKLTIDAVRKANLIQLMYEYCLLDSGNKQAGTAEKFLKLVA